jgi:hypothetical protein
MNLDDLISKYLDGELTEVEDNHLRSILSRDDDAKYKFDSSVNLHIAFREDARTINPPDSISQEIEDKILMRILSREPNVQKISTPRYRISSLAALIAIFALTAIVEISDLYRGGSSSVQTSLNDKNINIPTGSEEMKNGKNGSRIITDNKAVDIARQSNKAMKELNHPMNSSSSDDLNAMKESSHPMNSSSSDELNAVTEYKNEYANTGISETNAENSNEIRNASDIPTELQPPYITQNQLLNFTNQYYLINNNDENKKNYFLRNNNSYYLNPKDIGLEVSEIHFTSFLGSDLARSGIVTSSNSLISNFSLGISYSLNKNDFIGVDVGFAEYAYIDKINGSITIPAANAKSLVEVLNPGLQESYIINFPISLDRKKQIYWLSAFYERQLIEKWGFSLISRLGAGSSGDGFLGYTKMFAKYDIFLGFSFAIGIDARLFYTKMPELSSSSPDLKKSITLIYGFQFSL